MYPPKLASIYVRTLKLFDRMMQTGKILVLFQVLVIRLILCESSIEVQSQKTLFRGRIVTENGRQFGVFLKIPYAQPPVGQLRFAKPKPVDESNGPTTVDAAGNYSKKCMQPKRNPDDDEDQSEDCLYLNVMTPKFQVDNNENKLFPVMFWIHGGGFIFGSANRYPLDGILRHLVQRNVVIVTVNYRLGALGFWNTKSSVVPGNFGLWDQTEALKWVQKNIKAFGGDPTKVTIFGESAGGASVSLLTLSPVTRGLYQQAIVMSGSGLSPFAISYDDDQDDASGWLSEDLNCRSKIVRKLDQKCYSKKFNNSQDQFIKKQQETELQCMRCQSVKKIVETIHKQVTRQCSVSTSWTPRIDGDFFPENIETLILKRPPMKMIIGVTKEDGHGFVFMDNSSFTQDGYENVGIPACVTCQMTSHPKLIQSLVKYKYSSTVVPPKVDENYFWLDQNMKMVTSIMFHIPAYNDAVGALNTNSTVYMYSWDYSEAFEWYRADKNMYIKGPFHASELQYLFGPSDNPPKETTWSKRNKTLDETAKSILGELWTNFAKYGDPTPPGTPSGIKWPPTTLAMEKYLSIDVKNNQVVENFYPDEVAFWAKLIPEVENGANRNETH